MASTEDQCLFSFLNLTDFASNGSAVSNDTGTPTTTTPASTGEGDAAAASNPYPDFSLDLSVPCTAIAYVLEIIIPIIVYIVLVVLVARTQQQISKLRGEQADASETVNDNGVELVLAASGSSGAAATAAHFRAQLPGHLLTEAEEAVSAGDTGGGGGGGYEAFTFHDVTVRVRAGCCSGGARFSKTIADRISGSARGGELFAVLGPSGAGKTTLIDVLAGAVREQGALEVTGSVHLRGHALGLRERREQAAYIHQEDVLLGTATVRE
jgi:hypothetical protein